jgi:hypothetical protein
MKRVVLGALLVLAMMVENGLGKEIAGVDMPDSIKIDNGLLMLNGGGKRTRFGMAVYVGALYLQSGSSDPRKILEADQPMAIQLQITSRLVTSEKMEEATREGFNNSLQGDTAPLKTQIEAFIDVFREKISSDDVYTFIYTPGKGTEVLKNKQSLKVIAGLPFKKALFGIWLCDKPAQESLKQAMLGF